MKTALRAGVGMMRAFVMAGALVAVGSATASAAPISYEFTFDTSAYAGNTGTMDLSFGPGNAVVSSTMTLTSFNASGGTVGASTTQGDVTGSLPGTVTFGNVPNTNQLTQQMTFGQAVSFVLTFSGGVDTNFQISFLPGPTGTDPLPLFGTPIFLIDATGAITNWFVSPGPNGEPAAPFEYREVTAVPEPATLLLLSTGVLGLIARRRK